ncbi:hypothetical protein PFAG_01855 [Plasmodium falciparum Santa Lucia]|uniref:Uncharacterized protein n=1 Tax=Plasmodium falciparum Santa Lucia TaxID=478859 RepID=W7FSG5_PLAFA|nr:hypothetical protein PFAG_01855 [Plasmodium falciparum Santa Lucia]
MITTILIYKIIYKFNKKIYTILHRKLEIINYLFNLFIINIIIVRIYINNTEDNNNSKKSQPTIKCITKCGTHTSNSNIKKEKKKKRFNIFSAIAKKFFLSVIV